MTRRLVLNPAVGVTNCENHLLIIGHGTTMLFPKNGANFKEVRAEWERDSRGRTRSGRNSFSKNTADPGPVALPFVERNGVKIDYEIVGSGRPIILIPGLGGSIETSRLSGWLGVFPRNKLVVVDPRGRGKSDKPKERAAHRIEEYRDDVGAVLDASHLDDAVLLGLSDGAQICCALADAYPKLAHAIIDMDGFDDRDLSSVRLKKERIDLAKDVRKRGWSAGIAQDAPIMGYSPDSALMRELGAADSEMVALELEEWTKWKGPVSVLPRLKIPILRFVNGKRDPEEIERIRLKPGVTAELHIFPGMNHWRLCFDPGQTLGPIRVFLSRLGW